MNGRVYDPKLGRFLQADPFVQDAKNSQSLNRYTYVYNNPLSYTDPSGYFSLKSLWKKIRPFVAIAIAVWNPGALVFSGVWGAAATGFVAGYVGTGSIKGAVIGAFTAAAFYGIGSNFQQYAGTGKWGETALSGQAFAEKTVLHGLLGGVSTVAGGGKFGHGFLSAGITQAFGGWIGNIKTSLGKVAAAGVLGGSVSAVTGGKFANGALTGAFSRAFNDELHPFIQKTLHSLQTRKFWDEFGALTPDQFRALFPNLAAGWSDIDLPLIQQALIDEFYRSELPGRILDAAHDANDLLKGYTVGRVSGIVGARGRIAEILGKTAGLSNGQMRLVTDALAVKAFADQQNVNVYQLSNLADVLVANRATVNEAISNLQESP